MKVRTIFTGLAFAVGCGLGAGCATDEYVRWDQLARDYINREDTRAVIKGEMESKAKVHIDAALAQVKQEIQSAKDLDAEVKGLNEQLTATREAFAAYVADYTKMKEEINTTIAAHRARIEALGGSTDPAKKRTTDEIRAGLLNNMNESLARLIEMREENAKKVAADLRAGKK
ncbi:MAG: hypothetical protein HY719_00845 [Planctomycetes bacterium]|nr:hypothetical protein [Planctomycetota bacterium]